MQRTCFTFIYFCGFPEDWCCSNIAKILASTIISWDSWKLYRAAKLTVLGNTSKISINDVLRSYDEDLMQEGFEHYLTLSL